MKSCNLFTCFWFLCFILPAKTWWHVPFHSLLFVQPWSFWEWYWDFRVFQVQEAKVHATVQQERMWHMAGLKKHLGPSSQDFCSICLCTQLAPVAPPQPPLFKSTGSCIVFGWASLLPIVSSSCSPYRGVNTSLHATVALVQVTEVQPNRRVWGYFCTSRSLTRF